MEKPNENRAGTPHARPRQTRVAAPAARAEEALPPEVEAREGPYLVSLQDAPLPAPPGTHDFAPRPAGRSRVAGPAPAPPGAPEPAATRDPAPPRPPAPARSSNSPGPGARSPAVALPLPFPGRPPLGPKDRRVQRGRLELSPETADRRPGWLPLGRGSPPGHFSPKQTKRKEKKNCYLLLS